jgi:zinc resistance-associated protein
MRKTSAVIAIVLTLCVSSLALAQTPAGSEKLAATPAAFPSAEDVAALADSRMAALKTGLKIKPDQEKAWSAFEAVIRDLAKQRADRLAELINESQKTPRPAIVNPADVLRLRAKSMTQSAADLSKYADAIDPLFKSLDDGQKRRFLVLLAGR